MDIKNINPFGHDPSVEFPRAIEQQKNWTEHYFFQGYDFDREYGVCIHMGRMVDDPQLWRPTIQVYLPDQQLLVVTLWGRDGHVFGPGASPLKISCIEPFRLWSVEYDGVGQRVSRADLMADIVQDAPMEPIRFNLLFEAAGPVYGRAADMVEGRSVGNFHTEQIMKMRGHFQHRGELITVSGYGARDHSAGPRDYGPVVGDIWFQSQYENGDCLMVQVVRFLEAETRSSYYYKAETGELQMVEILDHPFVDSIDQPPGTVSRDPIADDSIRFLTIRCRTEAGEILEVKGELMHSHAISYMSPMEELNGTLRDGRDGIQMVECPARVTLNGMPGHALRERALRIRTLAPSPGRAG